MQEADKKFFIENGFLLIKGVFSEDECAGWKTNLLSEIERGKEMLLKSQQGPTPQAENRNRLADVPRGIRGGMLQDIAHRNDLFMRVAKDKRLLDCVAPFLGEDMVMFRSLCSFKPVGYTGAVEWHQDMSYWVGETKKITTWISLDKTSDASGALHVIPKTHHAQINDPTYQDYINTHSVPEHHIDLSKDVLLETNIGDVILIHSQTFHSSRPSTTGEDRYALIYTYQPASDQSHHREGPPVNVSAA